MRTRIRIRAASRGKEEKASSRLLSRNLANESADDFAEDDDDDINSLDVAVRPLRNCLPRANCVIRVRLSSDEVIPKKIVAQAVNIVRSKNSFAAIFKKKGGNRTFSVRRVKSEKGKVYVVTIIFAPNFQETQTLF